MFRDRILLSTFHICFAIFEALWREFLRFYHRFDLIWCRSYFCRLKNNPFDGVFLKRHFSIQKKFDHSIMYNVLAKCTLAIRFWTWRQILDFFLVQNSGSYFKHWKSYRLSWTVSLKQPFRSVDERKLRIFCLKGG